jgi:hypothetical protein
MAAQRHADALGHARQVGGQRGELPGVRGGEHGADAALEGVGAELAAQVRGAQALLGTPSLTVSDPHALIIAPLTAQDKAHLFRNGPRAGS